MIELRDGYVNRESLRNAFIQDLAIANVRARQADLPQYIEMIARMHGRIPVHGPTMESWAQHLHTTYMVDRRPIDDEMDSQIAENENVDATSQHSFATHPSTDWDEDPDIRMAQIGVQVACEAGFKERMGDITQEEFLDAYDWAQRQQVNAEPHRLYFPSAHIIREPTTTTTPQNDTNPNSNSETVNTSDTMNSERIMYNPSEDESARLAMGEAENDEELPPLEESEEEDKGYERPSGPVEPVEMNSDLVVGEYGTDENNGEFVVVQGPPGVGPYQFI